MDLTISHFATRQAQGRNTKSSARCGMGDGKVPPPVGSSA
jgi:hypothetical protein